MTAHDATTSTPQPAASEQRLYNTVPPQVDLPAMEHQILDFWDANGTFEATLEQTQASLQRWARGVSTPEQAVQPWLVTLTLRDIADPALRQRLAKVPTGFSLEPAQADELIAAGRALLRDNPDFRRLLEALGGTGAASSTK